MNSLRLTGLKCETCGTVFEPDGDTQSLCPHCPPHAATLECVINYEKAAAAFKKHPLKNRRDMSIFRYVDVLPVEDPDFHLPLQIGWTPVYFCPEAAKDISIDTVFVKDDSVNPSASYKDRASAMAVARAAELGYDAICTASTGNAAASLSACARSIHMPCIVFVPAGAPQAKMIQMQAYGAILFRVDGNYDQTFDLATQACEEFGWMNRSAGYNPYLVEGKKTGAWELAEQTGFNLPDSIFVSVGDGSIISGLVKGFKEMEMLGFIDSAPRVYGVQATGSAAVAEMWHKWDKKQQPEYSVMENASTVADSICVGNPREGIRALKSVRDSDGQFLTVTDEEIISAYREMPLKTGVFGEPAAATAYAGLKKARETDILNSKSRACVFVTGSGLKDLTTALETWTPGSDKLPPDPASLDIVNQWLVEYEKR